MNTHTRHEVGEHVRPEEIAAYLDRTASPEERRAIERHLVVCAECRRDLQLAAELGGEPRRTTWVKIGIPIAAAAVLAIAVLGPEGTERDSVLRGQRAEGTRTFGAVMPGDGAEVRADSLVFTWRSEGTGVHYLLTVTEESGDVLWTADTSDTTVALPNNVGVTPGQRYYWYVDALLEGAASSTTGVRAFVIRP